MDGIKNKMLGDVLSWAGNVSTSVLIVFVNKIVMKTTGYGFHYATTLTAFHFLVCSISIWVTQGLGFIKKTTMPKRDLALFTVVADLSILTLNLSLMVNTVSFYQIAKLLIIPFVCLIERFYLGRIFSREVVGSILLVICGVAVVTVEDLALEISTAGLFIAAVSVVSSGLQQIFVRTMQQKHKLSAHELLANTAPAQAWSLLFVGPFIDKLVTDDWVFQYHFSTAGAFFLLASCLLAVLVNISQFMCLGRFSAVSFQVLGHSKTILVLLGGWLFLGDAATSRKLLGMTLAVLGMIWYGKASSAPAPKVQQAAAKKLAGDAGVPLTRSGSPDVHVVVSASGAQHARSK